MSSRPVSTSPPSRRLRRSIGLLSHVRRALFYVRQVTAEDVREAIRLFQASTGQAVAADLSNSAAGSSDPRSLSFESPEQVGGP
jgi:hypothetical protein